jgi:ferritin-like protein
MIKPQVSCSHTCKELCTAMEIATLREKEAILQYDALRDDCTYPDIKAILNELILHRQKSIRLLEEAKALLKTKFEVLDQIREGFEMH